MRLLRDPALRRELMLFGLLSVILPLLALPVSPLLSLGLLIGILVSGLTHYFLSRRKYLQMEQLSHDLSGILHGSQTLLLDEYREGEISILRCALQKLLTQLQSANDALLAERVLLADSLADISHQLRTPMTSMELIVALLRSPGITEERRRQLLLELTRLQERTVWLIEALLRLSKLDAGTVRLTPQEISLRDLIRQAAEPLEVAMELREQTLLLELPDTSLVCDPQWTSEAIGNLLKNAMEHTPAGGTIQITASVSPIYTELIIRDTGTGFAPEDLPHLFERFYKGKNADPGSFGIGLALTRRILSEQECTVKASNHPKGGAVFTLRFYKASV